MNENISNYKKLLEEKRIPAGVDQRKIALELYNLGEEKYAIDFIVKQMNLYKDPSTHTNTKRETCMAAAITLGRLKDKRAVEPLFEALGEINRFAAAYALSKINGPEVEEKLLKLVSLKNKKGIQAAIALGLLKNEKVVPLLIQLIDNISEYTRKYENDMAMDLMEDFILRILGSYDNTFMEDVFMKYISKRHLLFLLADYMGKELYPNSYLLTNELGWHVVRKYQWDRYIDTREKREACEYTHSAKWAEDIRNEIVEKIWKEIRTMNSGLKV